MHACATVYTGALASRTLRYIIPVLWGQAHEADKTLPLPLLGLAQFHLLQQHHQAQQATSLLESALASQPGWTDAIQAGACLVNSWLVGVGSALRG